MVVETQDHRLRYDNTLENPLKPDAERVTLAGLSSVNGRSIMSDQIATVTWISGPVIRAQGSRKVSMLELVEVGEQQLMGEVIGLREMSSPSRYTKRPRGCAQARRYSELACRCLSSWSRVCCAAFLTASSALCPSLNAAPERLLARSAPDTTIPQRPMAVHARRERWAMRSMRRNNPGDCA